jgi:preprotein translocase subunit SecE
MTMIDAIRGFFTDVSKEMKKVSWPTQEQLRESTVVVVATCLVFAALVFVIDRGVVFLLEFIY